MKFLLRVTRNVAPLLCLAAPVFAQATKRITARAEWTTEDASDVTLTRPSRFVVDSAGRVFVPEASESVVYAFGANGAFLGKIGRKGSGPGESEGNCCATLDPSGRLWIRDQGNQRYVVYSLAAPSSSARVEAKAAFTVRMPHTDVNLWSSLHFDRSGNLYDVGHRPDAKDASARGLARFVVDTAGRVLRTYSIPEQAAGLTPSYQISVEKPGSVTTRSYYRPFSSRALRADGVNGEFVSAASGAYAITWYAADGAVKRVIRRAIQGPLLSAAEKKSGEEEIRRIANEIGKSASRLPFALPKYKPPLRGLEFDLDGRLWVERSTPAGAPRESDVYSPSGAYVFTVVWPPLSKMLFLGAARGRAAWVVTQDEDDVPHIVKLVF
ncbi:6-bladed beta-propeller [Gemmatimonas sp.]|uniref:6-bladed beta-propeller n=1 Tax=Gemmatimonas sp. TaxID=1962908 RepID=UPI0031C739D7|nr:hypothetical protein [Gemmatimonas sp.]